MILVHSSAWRALSGAALAAVAVLVSACGGGGSSGSAAQVASFDWSPVTPQQVASLTQVIKARDLSARSVSIVYEDASDTFYTVRIVQHTVNGVQHYGAVTVPKVPGPGKLAVVADLDGLEDNNAPLDVSRKLRNLNGQAVSAVFVFPAFRGRALQFGGRTWQAGGDWCDAFDGAADDTMALLNVVATIEPAADVSKLMVRGGSRGGGVSLLLGERDPRVKVVFAGSAPVDFVRQDVAAGYGQMYQCQFFTGKTPEQSRQAMIAASAFHFPMLSSVSKVYLDHGGADPIVPVLNATEMSKRIVADGVKVDLMIYPGAGHDLGQEQAYRDRRDAVFSAFIHN
jgi:dipeptidyl aminopeptidase/acylaminoacyl peptidase